MSPYIAILEELAWLSSNSLLLAVEKRLHVLHCMLDGDVLDFQQTATGDELQSDG